MSGKGVLSCEPLHWDMHFDVVINMFGLGAPALNGGGGVGGVDSLTETNDTIGAETREAQKPAAREAGDGHDESHKLLMAGPIEMA